MTQPASQPASGEDVDGFRAMDDVDVKRLALQGQVAAASELVRRAPGHKTVTAFLEGALTNDELKRLSSGQFDVLDDAFEAQWAAASRDTIEVPATNLNRWEYPR